jgi:hypothetical protein
VVLKNANPINESGLLSLGDKTLPLISKYSLFDKIAGI